MEKVAYLGLDAHTRRCVLGQMNSRGEYVSEWSFATGESNLIRHLVAIKAKSKLITLEEGPLAGWIRRTVFDYVDEVVVCDPRRNALISRAANKNDSRDAFMLCELLRLGALEGIYHPLDDDRAVFKSAVQVYLDVRDQLTAVKNKLKAKYRQWGVVDIEGTRVYGSRSRDLYVSRLREPAVRRQLEHYYRELDLLETLKAQARAEMEQLGQRYAEIREFRRVPGVGPIGAHVFDAYIQTPHRFATKQQVWRYCRLGVIHRQSDGRQLGRQRLDRAGNWVLKDMSYRAWLGALNQCTDNEVRRFYERSLERTHNKTHARLNTQRKIVAVLWTIWKTQSAYRSERFLSDPAHRAGSSHAEA